jgi:rubredoxin
MTAGIVGCGDISVVNSAWRNLPKIVASLLIEAPDIGCKGKDQMEWKVYQCVVCGFIYDEEQGLPAEGIAPGTRWEDIPDDWKCPECGVGKQDFEMVEF